MARKARVELEGAIHHVFQRGNGGRKLFLDDRDCRVFLDELTVTADRYEWQCLSYCLMTNHYHAIIETKERTLGDGMRRLGTVHARTCNRRANTYGHVFQARFGSVLVRSNAQLLQTFRYVARNPVAARLCADPSGWRWSNHRDLLEGDLEEGSARARVEDLLEEGGGRFGERYGKLFAEPTPWTPELDPSLDRPGLAELLLLTPRRAAIRSALDYGYRQLEIAKALGVSQATVSRWLRREGDDE